MKYIINILIVSTLMLFSCEDKLVDISTSPNTSNAANDGDVLTSAQGYIAAMQDVYLNRGESFMWAQYYTWGLGVSLGSEERFVSQPADFNGYWQMAYANSLTDLKYLNNSTSAGYRGVSQVLTAYVYQGLVDHFGDIPYSEALKGDPSEGGILTPKFDDASEIYADLVVKIDAALVDLDKAEDGEIGDKDLIYGGDIKQWIKFANSLKLRILMRTSEVSPQSDKVKDLIDTGVFLETKDDVAKVDWSGETGNKNPMYSVMMNGVGDFYFASNASVNVLSAKSDPRDTIFYRKTSGATRSGTIFGIDQGSVDNEPFTADPKDYSQSGAYANGETVPTILMSPWEVWFLRAEADARYSTIDDEAAAFSSGVGVNFEYTGVGDANAYVTSLNYDAAGELKPRLDEIAVQKWISMNGTQEDEGWIETRRFDRPDSRLFTEGIFQNPPESSLAAGIFPASWLYPATAVSFNPNTPSQRKITDRLFWDN